MPGESSLAAPRSHTAPMALAAMLRLLLAIAALSLGQAAAGPSADAPAGLLRLAPGLAPHVPFFPNRSSIVVCTGERVPMTMCQGLDPADFSGVRADGRLPGMTPRARFRCALASSALSSVFGPPSHAV